MMKISIVVIIYDHVSMRLQIGQTFAPGMTGFPHLGQGAWTDPIAGDCMGDWDIEPGACGPIGLCP